MGRPPTALAKQQKAASTKHKTKPYNVNKTE